MWHVTAGRQLTCDACDHLIPTDEYCISDLPEKLPKSVARDEYRHFHLDCQECERAEAESPTSCYQLLASMLVSDKARAETICLFCGHTILEGEDRLQDFLLVRDGGSRLEAGQGPAALISAVANCEMVNPTAFSQLSHQVKGKFSRAGLGNSRGGYRNLLEAQELYRTSIPGPVRNLGAAPQLTNGKDASHIISVQNAPHLASDPKNIIWESTKANAKRGSRNMTKLEIVKANGVNAAQTARIVGGATVVRATKGAGWAALIELPVTVVENGINVYRGKKTKEMALKDIGADVAKAGIAGGIFAGGITVAVALGAGPALAATGPVLIPVGVGLFAFSAGSRIRRAWKDGLTKVDLNFHANRISGDTEINCYQSFAEWVSSYPVREVLTEESEPVQQWVNVRKSQNGRFARAWLRSHNLRGLRTRLPGGRRGTFLSA